MPAIMVHYPKNIGSFPCSFSEDELYIGFKYQALRFGWYGWAEVVEMSEDKNEVWVEEYIKTY